MDAIFSRKAYKQPEVDTGGHKYAAVDHQQVLEDHADLMAQMEGEKRLAEELSRKRPAKATPQSPPEAPNDDFSQISQMVSKSVSLPPPLPVDLSGSDAQYNYYKEEGVNDRKEEVEDAQTEQRQSVSDVEVMQRNNRSMMDALNTERHRAELLEEDVSMAKLEKDAEIDEYKLVITRLKSQIRTLVSERSLDEVYDVMEEDITRLSRELEMTRARNLVLENKMLDNLMIHQQKRGGVDDATTSFLDMDGGGEFSFSHTQAPGQPGLSASFLSDTTGLSKKESKRLIAQVKHQNFNIEALKKENEALKSTERLHNISVRQTKDAARRVYLSTQQADRAKADYEKERGEHLETGKCLAMVRNEVGALHDENRDLKMTHDKLLLQIASLKRELGESESRRKRERKLNNFVMKHVPGAKDNSMVMSHRGIGAASKSFHAKDDEDDDDNDANRSFRRSIRKAQTDTQQLRALQKHKLDEGVVNDVLTELRAEAVFRAPSMLATIRTLMKVIHEEREIWRYMSAVVKEVRSKK